MTKARCFRHFRSAICRRRSSEVPSLTEGAPRKLISISLFLASSVTVLTPEGSAVAGLSGIWIVTVVMGIAQGPLFPASMSYLAKWLPAAERLGRLQCLIAVFRSAPSSLCPCLAFLRPHSAGVLHSSTGSLASASLLFGTLLVLMSLTSARICPWRS